MCLCGYVLSHRQWCWWWQPIGKSPGWAWQGPQWCQSPRVCPLQKHTDVSIKAAVMSGQHCCVRLVTLVPAQLGSNGLWNYLVIGTQSKWRNHTCWTWWMGNVHGHTCFLFWHFSQWQIWSVCTDSGILISDSADCDTQGRLRGFSLLDQWKINRFLNNQHRILQSSYSWRFSSFAVNATDFV